MEIFTDENYISLICNGEFDAIPDFPIGELFESFFDNINYNVVKQENVTYVDFTGDATCDDEPCTILIRFRVNDSVTEFEIVEVKVDEDILDEDEIIDLLEDIAYVGGAIIDDGCCSCGDCDENHEGCSHHCHHDDCDCDDEEDDDYDYDEEEDYNDEGEE